MSSATPPRRRRVARTATETAPKTAAEKAVERAAPWAMVVIGLLLAWQSQISLRLSGPARLAVLALGVLAVLVAVARLWRLRWWRSPVVLTWWAWWAALAVAATLTWRSLPIGETPVLGEVRAVVSAREEIAQLGLGAAAASALLVLSRGERRGVRGFRWLWLAILVTTAPVALWEIRTDQHIVLSRWGEGVWNFTPHVPAATFTNPNNYACVLVAVVGALLGWSLAGMWGRASRWGAALLLAAAVFATWLVWATLSRGAFAAIAVQLVVAAVGLAAALGLGARLRASRAGRLGATVVGALLAVGLLASFVVPALAARNQLLRAPKAGEEASDAQRIELIRAGLRYWRESPWLGTGPGTYEYHLATGRPVGVPDPTINAHNAFVEILSQYGLLGTVPLALLVGVLGWYAVRPARRERALATCGISARVEIGALLVAFAVTGVVVSSALAMPLWCVMLAHATAVAWSCDPGERGAGSAECAGSAGEVEPAHDGVQLARDPGEP